METPTYEPVAKTMAPLHYQVSLSEHGRFVEVSRIHPEADCAGIFIRDDLLSGRSVDGTARATIDLTDWDVPVAEFEDYDFFEYRAGTDYYRVPLGLVLPTRETRTVSGSRVDERHPLWPPDQSKLDSDIEQTANRRADQARARIERAQARERRENERERQAAQSEANMEDRVRAKLKAQGYSDQEIEKFL